MKIAIVADSNSGITQDEAKNLGVSVLPMPFMIDGTVYYEGIDLSHEEFYKKMEEGADITTSQPSPKDVLECWDSLLEEHDQVVYIPMSSGLSGSCQTALMLAEDYDKRVQVVNNQRISVTQRQSALDARDLAAKGYCAKEIKDILEATKFDSIIYITVDTLKRRQDYACGRGPWHPVENQAGADHRRGEAGCIFKGKDHEAGKADHADCPGP